jgi:hypothetical protein
MLNQSAKLNSVSALQELSDYESESVNGGGIRIGSFITVSAPPDTVVSLDITPAPSFLLNVLNGLVVVSF